MALPFMTLKTDFGRSSNRSMRPNHAVIGSLGPRRSPYLPGRVYNIAHFPERCIISLIPQRRHWHRSGIRVGSATNADSAVKQFAIQVAGEATKSLERLK